MSGFNPDFKSTLGLNGIVPQKDLDTVFGCKNIRGSAIRPPLREMSQDSILNIQRTLGVELGYDGAIKLSPDPHGVKLDIDIPDQQIQVMGKPRGVIS